MATETQTTDSQNNTGATGGDQTTTGDQTAQDQTTQQAADTSTTTTDKTGATDTTQADADGNAGDKKDGTDDKTRDKDTTAPIEYTFELPEGVTLDEEIGASVKEFAKEKNLTKEEAQKLIDLGVKQRTKEAEAFQQQRETWRESVRTDKEIGGEHLEANLSLAKKAVDAFGTPEAKQLLNESWLGDHPAIIKTFVAIGKAISEDKLVVTGGTPTGDGASIAQRMYPNMNP